MDLGGVGEVTDDERGGGRGRVVLCYVLLQGLREGGDQVALRGVGGVGLGVAWFLGRVVEGE